MAHNQRYSSHELNTIRDRYRSEGASRLAVLLERSPDGIKALAKRLGLATTDRRAGARWTQAKDRQLRSHARAGLTPSQIASRMGVATATIASHARALDLTLKSPKPRKDVKKTAWADWELAIIDQYYATEGAARCSARLPGRSIGAIRHKRCVRAKRQQQSARRDTRTSASAATPRLSRRRFFTSS